MIGLRHVPQLGTHSFLWFNMMTKGGFNRSFVRQLTKKLKHKMEKKDTKYKFAIFVSIKVARSLYKLAHASEYLQCSEFFCHWKIHCLISVLRVCSCCKWCFQGSISMACTWKTIPDYGGVQKVVKVAKYSRCDRCNSNSRLKAKMSQP